MDKHRNMCPHVTYPPLINFISPKSTKLKVWRESFTSIRETKMFSTMYCSCATVHYYNVVPCRNKATKIVHTNPSFQVYSCSRNPKNLKDGEVHINLWSQVCPDVNFKPTHFESKISPHFRTNAALIFISLKLKQRFPFSQGRTSDLEIDGPTFVSKSG